MKHKVAAAALDYVFRLFHNDLGFCAGGSGGATALPPFRWALDRIALARRWAVRVFGDIRDIRRVAESSFSASASACAGWLGLAGGRRCRLAFGRHAGGGGVDDVRNNGGRVLSLVPSKVRCRGRGRIPEKY